MSKGNYKGIVKAKIQVRTRSYHICLTNKLLAMCIYNLSKELVCLRNPGIIYSMTSGCKGCELLIL